MQVILVASGKGGTGKTSFTAGIGAALTKLNRRVLLIDGDCGLRNLDLTLGLSDRIVYSFADVANDVISLEDAMVSHPKYTQLSLLTAPIDLPVCSLDGIRRLTKQAETAGFDYIFIDGPAGLPSQLERWTDIAEQAVLVTTTDFACVRGAERCARKLEDASPTITLHMALNRICPQLIRKGKSGNIDDAMDQTGLPLLGIIPNDQEIIICGNCGKIILEKNCPSARAFQRMARRLEGEYIPLAIR